MSGRPFRTLSFESATVMGR